MMHIFLDNIEAIDRWLDGTVDSQYVHQPLAQDWARISKVGEEYGEAVAAFIGSTGQNPRKGYTHVQSEVLDELADTAMTALLAIQHFTKDKALTGKILTEKARKIMVRAVSSREAINDTYLCTGCGRNFTEPNAPHSPCNPA